jgi:hypothetical protein
MMRKRTLQLWRKTGIIGAACGMALLGAGFASQATGAESGVNDTIANALKGDWGQIKFNLRYRWEHVEQDGKLDTDGDPIRLRIGYLTPKLSYFQAYAEFEGNTAVFEDDYNDKTNGKTDYAVIADPDSKGELNQAWLTFSGIPDTPVKVGRQRIILDNARFVGNVGWRQMEQTYDAVRIINTSVDNLTLDGTYIWNVRNILSKDNNMSSMLFNVGYKVPKIGKLTAYAYLLDYDDLAAKSSQTYGFRFGGAVTPVDNFKILYLAEYAMQSDYQDNPADFDADYYHINGGFKIPDLGPVFKNLTAKIGYEYQGSDNGVSFKTPLGTNHAFNGWVDKFLATPANGLTDFYGMISGNLMGLTAKFIYHTFDAEEGSADYGDEFDVMLKYAFNKHYSVLAAYGTYDADEYATDTDKFWLQLVVNF